MLAELFIIDSPPHAVELATGPIVDPVFGSHFVHFWPIVVHKRQFVPQSVQKCRTASNNGTINVQIDMHINRY